LGHSLNEGLEIGGRRDWVATIVKNEYESLR